MGGRPGGSGGGRLALPSAISGGIGGSGMGGRAAAQWDLVTSMGRRRFKWRTQLSSVHGVVGGQDQTNGGGTGGIEAVYGKCGPVCTSFHPGADYSLHTRPYKVSGSTQKLQKRLKPGAQVGTENMRKASIHQQPQEEETPGLVHVSLSIQIWS
uniref:Uncharacterized protein n=1 Tax=Oryza glumipatula TaxID=40148 RepID=A0A0D9ZGL4_9ORYZ